MRSAATTAWMSSPQPPAWRGRGGLGREVGHHRRAAAVPQRLGVVAGGGRPDRVLRADASVLGPSGIDPSLADCCACRYSMPATRGRSARIRCPRWRRRASPRLSPAVASATTLLVLPMSVPHAARGLHPCRSGPRRMRLPPVVRGDGGRRLGSVSWLTDQRRNGRLPGSSRPRWHDGRRLPAHSCATAPDSHRLPVTRSVIQLWPSSMRRVPRIRQGARGYT